MFALLRASRLADASRRSGLFRAGAASALGAAAGASAAAAAGAAAAAAAGAARAAPARALFVRVTGNPAAALERLQAKAEQEGLERMLAARRRFVKPHLARQRSASDALYNRSKRERIRLVEELVLDRKLVPF